ncbi:type II toxin-antitoxin system ParD family antitoxin [Jiella mangrovi]|uniref:Type II toxin-antitoxin system ParD family antitoxin n=1 Tax=Jiella mangrovi TaxID=2821407 RepID=A0ABS4BN83_9HYPH|nr:type II toxin-antitoxin system ParD family antitoxin [Jiella mangrovi]MBP0618195.1 type II toxin-antitoxin system ParD family antitoxin [Jiella mangrovi]
MATMTVFLSSDLKTWVESQVKSGQYDDAGDYVRELIRLDHARAEARLDLQQIVDNALASGISEKGPDELLAEARARFRQASDHDL